MAKNYENKLGQSNSARSPSGISNAEHYDVAGVKKSAKVTPGTYVMSPNSNVETAVEPRQLIRFFNTNAAVQFVWIGEAGLNPAVTIATGLAIGPNEEMIIATGDLVSGKSVAFKTSSVDVQAALLE